MWIYCSEVLSPLTKLISKEAKWQWTDTVQKACNPIKRIVEQEMLLAYPNFNEVFEIRTCTDTSHT